eukprot:NODE_19290_length_850_cov_3.694329.p3 GENE.NODE_19290_length_850_cov_3.694329~~NODE_19290_length_850_cov_3.694329.p3  ORF type:complete len:124 (+),score=21.87 NODE_19290_length_850_cov_3.694329:447-818(+)
MGEHCPAAGLWRRDASRRTLLGGGCVVAPSSICRAGARAVLPSICREGDGTAPHPPASSGTSTDALAPGAPPRGGVLAQAPAASPWTAPGGVALAGLARKLAHVPCVDTVSYTQLTLPTNREG